MQRLNLAPISIFCKASWIAVNWLLLVFPMFVCAQQQPIVVLLSATEQVGHEANVQLIKGIKRHLPPEHWLQVVRLDDFNHFSTAWQAVLDLNPKLVIGPLHKEDVQKLIQTAPKIPVIALNQTSLSHPMVWQFSLTAEQPIYQLAIHLAEKDMSELLLLSVNSSQAMRLTQSFMAVHEASIKERLIYQSSEQLLAALYTITGYHKSRRRIQELEKLIQEPLVAMPWLRQDVEALVLFSSLADAIEVSHQVDYAWGQSFSLYWVDTGANSTSDYVRSLPNWGRMKSFMPFYQIEAMQQQRLKTDGFFTALGEDAIRLSLMRLSHAPRSKDSRLKGSLGYLHVDAQQRIQTHFPLVWLGDGQVDVINDAMNEPSQ
jgi:outer membrane PBP1 activator LpoA protein